MITRFRLILFFLREIHTQISDLQQIMIDTAFLNCSIW